jgi:hypothetical protein
MLALPRQESGRLQSIGSRKKNGRHDESIPIIPKVLDPGSLVVVIFVYSY